MAYDSSKETRYEIGVVTTKEGERPEYLRIAGVQYGNGPEKIDMRLWYTDNDGNIRPTNSGFRFKREYLKDVMVALIKAFETSELNEFLEEASDAILE